MPTVPPPFLPRKVRRRCKCCLGVKGPRPIPPRRTEGNGRESRRVDLPPNCQRRVLGTTTITSTSTRMTMGRDVLRRSRRRSLRGIQRESLRMNRRMNLRGSRRGIQAPDQPIFQPNYRRGSQRTSPRKSLLKNLVQVLRESRQSFPQGFQPNYPRGSQQTSPLRSRLKSQLASQPISLLNSPHGSQVVHRLPSLHRSQQTNPPKSPQKNRRPNPSTECKLFHHQHPDQTHRKMPSLPLPVLTPRKGSRLRAASSAVRPCTPPNERVPSPVPWVIRIAPSESFAMRWIAM